VLKPSGLTDEDNGLFVAPTLVISLPSRALVSELENLHASIVDLDEISGLIVAEVPYNNGEDNNWVFYKHDELNLSFTHNPKSR
jgi:hypothetical protein